MVKDNNGRMPVLFIGHGSPENAIEDNEFSQAWKEIASKIPKPKCILCISAHWLRSDTSVTSRNDTEIIYDFYGFPKALYDLKYPVKGSKEYAQVVKESVGAVHVSLDDSWGIDHGTWSVLIHMYPDADVPVIQLSINPTLSLEKSFAIGESLVKLRDKGFLIIGSGNIVHNLGAINWGGKPYPWAIDFDKYVMDALMQKDFDKLLNYKNHSASHYAVPTNDHYLPLIYVIGASVGEIPIFFCEKIVYGSLSMRCVAYGLK